jgi:ABC-type antimicrobial peptide transport system permease subunit
MALTDAFHDMREDMHDLVSINHVDAARQAYIGLWATFVVAPLVLGVDKFTGFLTGDWAGFVATWVDNILPGTTAGAVMVLGVVEVLLAVAVALAPRIGGDLMALYLLLAAFSFFAIGGAAMVVLGITALAGAVCALAMARLSTTYHRR